MFKVYLNKDNSIHHFESIEYKEVFICSDENAYNSNSYNIVIDEKKWEPVLYKDSYQFQKRLDFLKSKKNLNFIEKEELRFIDFISNETDKEKKIDKEEVLSFWRYLVNITSKWKKKVATIYDSTTSNPNTSIEYDEERWDITTDDLFIAEKYKSFIENESLEAAMDWYKSL